MATINFELSKQRDKSTKKSQILVRVSISRSFRVGGKTGLFISPKDWDAKAMHVRKISRIESRDKQLALEDLRKQLDRLKEHIGQVIIDTKDFDSLSDKSDSAESPLSGLSATSSLLEQGRHIARERLMRYRSLSGKPTTSMSDP